MFDLGPCARSSPPISCPGHRARLAFSKGRATSGLSRLCISRGWVASFSIYRVLYSVSASRQLTFRGCESQVVMLAISGHPLTGEGMRRRGFGPDFGDSTDNAAQYHYCTKSLLPQPRNHATLFFFLVARRVTCNIPRGRLQRQFLICPYPTLFVLDARTHNQINFPRRRVWFGGVGGAGQGRDKQSVRCSSGQIRPCLLLRTAVPRIGTAAGGLAGPGLVTAVRRRMAWEQKEAFFSSFLPPPPPPTPNPRPAMSRMLSKQTTCSDFSPSRGPMVRTWPVTKKKSSPLALGRLDLHAWGGGKGGRGFLSRRPRCLTRVSGGAAGGSPSRRVHHTHRTLVTRKNKIKKSPDGAVFKLDMRRDMPKPLGEACVRHFAIPGWTRRGEVTSSGPWRSGRC